MITTKDYLSLLENWVKSTKRHLRPLPHDKSCISFGPGNKGHWAQQTNNTALGAFAELAVSPYTDFARVGLSRDETMATALALLRFTINGHISGKGTCADGEKWGHSWISNLCLERMAHSFENLEPYTTVEDQENFQNLLISECDWLLDEYPVVAGFCPPENKPESNMWNGSVLWRTALRYPDAPRAEEYKEKGTKFLLNACSMPQDAESEELFRGKPLKEWHVGANFFPSCACNHHYYMNVGYINITLSNLAMLHFSGKYYGWQLPKALYLHAKEIWEFTKSCIFPDGRLLRIGGDTRVRYCYCQDYAIMVWLLARDLFGDADTEQFEAGWLKTVALEQGTNPDGSFMGNRLRTLESISPLYFTRLEGDKAASLSMAACWHRRFHDFQKSPIQEPVKPLTAWFDDFHGSFLSRSPKRIASWTWVAAEPPMGLCLPTNASNMAEWRFNMSGQILGMGPACKITSNVVTKESFPGGFITSGNFTSQQMEPGAEGEQSDIVAKTQIAYAALPDDATVVVFQRATSLNRFYFMTVKGFGLNVLNDIYNGQTRTLECETMPPQTLRTPTLARETLSCGSWLNIDGQLAVRSFNGPLLLNRPERPQIAIKKPEKALIERCGGQNYAEEICAGTCFERTFPRVYEKDEVLFDIACAVRIGVTAEETAAWCAEQPSCDIQCDTPSALRKAVLRGADGKTYAVCFNVGDADLAVKINGQATTLAPEASRVFTL
ncbi:MAG: hypothetical protein IKP00_11580 [Victivallales bacterium]|nr:hypothetical protein [Victivallales bacterium]